MSTVSRVYCWGSSKHPIRLTVRSSRHAVCFADFMLDPRPCPTTRSSGPMAKEHWYSDSPPSPANCSNSGRNWSEHPQGCCHAEEFKGGREALRARSPVSSVLHNKGYSGQSVWEPTVKLGASERPMKWRRIKNEIGGFSTDYNIFITCLCFINTLPISCWYDFIRRFNQTIHWKTSHIELLNRSQFESSWLSLSLTQTDQYCMLFIEVATRRSSPKDITWSRTWYF